MLTDEDLQKIAALLETYGLKKETDRKRSLAAERQRRFRERNADRNAKVTRQRAKRNAESNAEVTQFVSTFLLNDGSEFGVTEEMVKKFEALYPLVDVPQTLREIEGWCLANQPKRKTRNGAMKFLNGWLAREQNKG